MVQPPSGELIKITSDWKQDSVPPYRPGSSLGSTTIGSWGNRSFSGGSSPAATRRFKLGASVKVWIPSWEAVWHGLVQDVGQGSPDSSVAEGEDTQTITSRPANRPVGRYSDWRPARGMLVLFLGANGRGALGTRGQQSGSTLL